MSGPPSPYDSSLFSAQSQSFFAPRATTGFDKDVATGAAGDGVMTPVDKDPRRAAAGHGHELSVRVRFLQSSPRLWHYSRPYYRHGGNVFL